MKSVVALCLALTACSTQVNPPCGIHLTCEATSCPAQEEVEVVVFTFRDEIAALFDPYEDLHVRWMPFDADLGTSPDGGRIIGLTPAPDEVLVTSMRVLAHELMHVHLWRVFPESYGDGNHETPPGPWTETTNETIRAFLSDMGY